MALRQSLQKLMPADHPEFELNTNPAKRGSTVDFNGIQVNFSGLFRYIFTGFFKHRLLK
jgi:hypothetical protein